MRENRRPLFRTVSCLLAAASLLVIGGCATRPALIPPEAQQTVDRSLVEYPAGFRLQTIVRNLKAPTAITFDHQDSIIIADEGLGERPRIFGFKPDGTHFDIYPRDRRLLGGGEVYGPIGGMVAANDRIYVFHRDAQHRGVISAFDYSGGRETIVGDLPTEGDHGALDLVLNRADGRLYFSVGSMTNSGVVGLDNWQQGWVDRYAEASDQPAVAYKLLGYRFDTPNPRSGLFGGSDLAVTGPFQPFGLSKQTTVPPPATGKPTAAIYSISTGGGDLRVEAHGVRCARGLAFNEFGRLYATNQGMELRGTRPVKDDPDSLLRIIRNTWYGWPDFSADLLPITERKFQPPTEMIARTGYPELSFLVDHQSSGLLRPDRGTLVQAVFQPLSGAAKLDFAPSAGPFRGFYGSAFVALSGDRAPFATSGYPLVSRIGYRIIQVDVDNHVTTDLIYNTRRLPGSEIGKHPDLLERPFDVKFGPEGAVYILDMGQVQMKGAKAVPVGRTGKIMRLDANR